MKPFCIALFLFVLFVFPAFAQPKPSGKAVKLFEKAQTYKKARDFDKAIDLLKKAVAASPSYAAAHYDLANQYLMLGQNGSARTHLEQVVQYDPDNKGYVTVYAILAEMSANNGEYEEAKKYAQRFLSSEMSSRFKRETDRCNWTVKKADFALAGMKNPVNFSPKPLPPTVNILGQQYFPVLTADQQTLIFTGRSGSDENMYQTKWENGQWGTPLPIKELNSTSNEGTCSISADGKILIFTACEGAKDRPVYGACDLFISFYKNGKWSDPQNMGARVNTRGWESQPSLSADGRSLYFVSERGGGQGGKDIWMSQLDKNNQWSAPVNLGPAINTPDDEVSPFIHVNGKTLFFASRGHLGFGGLDLFMAEKEGNTWGMPKNLGYPINDHNDQVSLSVTADGRKAFYSNEQLDNGRLVASILTEFDLPKETVARPSDVVKGRIFDAKTKQPIGASLVLTDLATKEAISQIASDEQTGEYLFVLTEGAEYALHISRDGYLFKSQSFDYQQETDPKTIELDVYLDPVEYEKPVTLNNIFFETGSYELMTKSQTELDKLVDFLKQNPTAKIEIGGHTDDVGSDEANMTLSRNRAQSVVEYLKTAGIAETRLSSKGYGETQPVAPNDSDTNRALNRRIEFRILK